MYVARSDTFNSVYPDLVAEILEQPVTPIGRPGAASTETKELHPAIIEVEDPLRRLVTSWNRPVNVAFALAEVLWILTGSNDVEMLACYNSNIGNYSDDGSTFNAAYGHRLRVAHGHDQLIDLIEGLVDDPTSRQGILNIWHPTHDRAFHLNENVPDLGTVVTKNSTRDRACNVIGQAMIRDGKLNWTQYMRSNDAIWGVPYNWIQWSHIAEFVANAVGVPVGKYVHVANSLHIYGQHWAEASSISYFDLYNALQSRHFPFAVSFHDLSRAARVERTMREEDIYRPDEKLPQALTAMLEILWAHQLFRSHSDEECFDWLERCSDAVYAAAQIRFYISTRWHKEVHAKWATSRVVELEDDVPIEAQSWMLAA